MGMSHGRRVRSQQLLFFFLLILLFFAIRSMERSFFGTRLEPLPPMEKLSEEAARDQIAFSMRVLGHLARGEEGGGANNLAVSPLSIHSALVLLAAGARGATLDQIVAVLGPAGGPKHAGLASHVARRVFADGAAAGSDGPTLRSANGLWMDDRVRPEPSYARVLSEYYGSESSLVPFNSKPEEARSKINQWIADATAGRIKELLPEGSIRDDTAAVLANALYFKGSWSDKYFETALTAKGKFYLLPTNSSGGHVRVPFMSSTRKQHVVSRPGYKVLRLPYAQGLRGKQAAAAFSMYIYLPDKVDGLPSLLDKLVADPSLLETSATMASEVRMSRFKVPKFTLSHKTKVSEMLRDMGMSLPFDPFGADFGGMTTEPPPERIYAKEVYHQCSVEVNEEGTEAAAATGVTMCFMTSVRMVPSEDFVADHPFMFVIKEEVSGVVVFAGQVTNPTV